MKTAGIDLSVDPKKTATCVITWCTTPSEVQLFSALPHAELVAIVDGAGKVGVDCPFGWPEPFVGAVSDFAAGRGWPPSDGVLGLDRFALRRTDLAVKDRTGLRPLAVTADRIGRTAMHWAFLQRGLGLNDRTGRSGLLAEVYPAATLKRWGLPFKGLKGKDGAELRRSVLDALEQGIDDLRLEADVRDRCAARAERRVGPARLV